MEDSRKPSLPPQGSAQKRREDRFPSLRKLAAQLGMDPAERAIAFARASAGLDDQNASVIDDLTLQERYLIMRLIDDLKASNGKP